MRQRAGAHAPLLRPAGAALACAALLALGVAADAARAQAPHAPLQLVVVLDLSAPAEHADLAAALSERLAARIAILRDLRVLRQAELRTLLDQARREQLEACGGRPACMANLGASIGARTVVRGTLDQRGRAWLLELEALDLAGGPPLRSTRAVCRPAPALVQALEDAALSLWANGPYEAELGCRSSVHELSASVDLGRRALLSSSWSLTTPSAALALQYAWLAVPRLSVLARVSLGQASARRAAQQAELIGLDALVGFELHALRTAHLRLSLGAGLGLSLLGAAPAGGRRLWSQSFGGGLFGTLLWLPVNDAWGLTGGLGLDLANGSPPLFELSPLLSLRASLGVMLRL